MTSSGADNLGRGLRTQRRLRLLASAVEAAGDAIVITDPSGRIQWANASYGAMTGFNHTDVLGARLGVLQGRRARLAPRGMWETLLSGNVWMGEVRLQRRDGRAFLAAMSITPVLLRRGTVDHFVAVARDITAQKTLEAQFHQAQKMEAVGQLAGGIAHDFNNLMTAIIGYAEIVLAQISKDDPVHTDVAEIRAAGARAAALTRQLLAFSRKQLLKPTTFDVRDTLGGLERMLRRVIRENIVLTLQPGEQTQLVRADVGQIEQVVLNLVINASDAMPDGGRLTVSCRSAVLDEDFVRAHPGASTGRFVALEVTDTGVGIAPEALSHIFEPFFTTKALGKGTGLGLSVVYGIVKQSGGYITAESTQGHGASFTVYLPEVAELDVAQAEPAPLPAVSGRNKAATILVAEDDATIRDLVCRLLRDTGYHVVTGTNAAETYEAFTRMRRAPSLLLTDVIMPEINGLELARRIHERYPDLPVIYMSGYHDVADMRTGPDGRLGNLVEKPVTPDVLLRAVHEVLAGSAATIRSVRRGASTRRRRSS